MKSGNF